MFSSIVKCGLMKDNCEYEIGRYMGFFAAIEITST
jgi:hypothetical protein